MLQLIPFLFPCILLFIFLLWPSVHTYILEPTEANLNAKFLLLAHRYS
jgi:TRAP-type mannitol/chloroaromatic compound transport system permease small subunit